MVSNSLNFFKKPLLKCSIQNPDTFLIFASLSKMRIVEFRVIVPFTMEQTRIASRYANARRAKEGTKGGDGVEMIEKKEIEEEGVKGIYAHRIYHVKSHVPAAIKWVLPEKYSHVHEHYKNVFPHYDTYFEIPDMGSDMVLKNESRIIPYHKGDQIPDNIMGLSEEHLQMRKIVYLDLVNGSGGRYDEYKVEGFSCPEAGISKISAPNKTVDESNIPSWVQNYEGTMTLIIKCVTFEFKWWGAQSLVERIVPGVFHDMFMGTHKAMILWSPEWCHLDDAGVDRYENQVRDVVNKSDFDKNDKEFKGKVRKGEAPV